MGTYWEIPVLAREVILDSRLLDALFYPTLSWSSPEKEEPFLGEFLGFLLNLPLYLYCWPWQHTGILFSLCVLS